jgi:diguanylate cyclase (GGDEF)-like protein
MPFFQKPSSSWFVRSTACHASSQLASARRSSGFIMAALGWPLACGLAAIALWFKVQWWDIDHAALGDANATVEAELESGALPVMTDPSAQAMLAKYQQLVHQHLFFANMLLFGLGLLGMMLAVRLEKRRQHAEQVRNACLNAMDAGREGFLILRPQGHGTHHTDFVVQDCNERGAVHAGLASRDLLGRRLSELRDREWSAGLARACRHAMAAGLHEEVLETGRDGQRVCLQRRLMRADAGLVIMLRDISDTRANQDILMKMAHLDTLTGLPNRLWLTHFLPRAIESAAATASSLAVLFIDLDDFKSVNDTCGHDAGDALLVAAAGRLAAAVRVEDKLARLGGDEFVIVLAKADHAEIVQVARRITAALAEDFMLIGHGCRQTQGSIGISVYPQDGTCAASLLRNADLAMYTAKSSGKGRYAFHAASQAGLAEPLQPAAAWAGTRV